MGEGRETKDKWWEWEIRGRHPKMNQKVERRGQKMSRSTEKVDAHPVAVFIFRFTCDKEGRSRLMIRGVALQAQCGGLRGLLHSVHNSHSVWLPHNWQLPAHPATHPTPTPIHLPTHPPSEPPAHPASHPRCQPPVGGPTDRMRPCLARPVGSSPPS